jgi:hypothetical protein
MKVATSMSSESSTTAVGEHPSPSHPQRAPRFRARSLQKVNEWGDAREPRKVQKKITNGDNNSADYEEYQYGSTNIKYDESNYPIEYSCSALAREELSETVIWFDLEASFEKDADVEKNVRKLEWSLLANLAETIGLKNDCALEVQHQELRRALSSNPRRSLTQTYLKYPTTIFTLSSDPGDADSATTGKQRSLHSIMIEKAVHAHISLSNLNSQSSGDCDFQEYNPSTEECFKVRSRMWAQFRGDEVDDYLRTIISEKLKNNPNLLFAGEITGITFVGDGDVAEIGRNNTAAELGGDNSQVKAAPSQRALGAPTLGTVVGASAFAFVVGALLLVARKKRKDSATQKVEVDTLLNLAIETGSATDPPRTTKRAPFDQSIQPSTPKIKNVRLKAEGNPPRNPTPHPTRLEDTTDATDSDSTNAIAGDGQVATSGIVMVAGMSALPPRPPAQRKNSTSLKKVRGKKKRRKKTPSLQRVNSKEGINEMATISESEDEDSEFGSEYDSDCSTEEVHGSRPSSRVSSATNSPTRPKPRTGSRTSTSLLSPEDELFPSDVFSDYDFAFESSRTARCR